MVLPSLATSHARSDRVRCFNNLRQIGNAVRHFALEHDGYPPWRIQAGEDGNYNNPGKHNLWFQYWWLRDLIKDPGILMDPGETRANARVAASWDFVPQGLMSYKDNAVAYMLAVDTTFLPQSLLVADRHISDVGIGGCSSGISTVANLPRNPFGGPEARWLNEVHGPFGNLAFTDGSVVMADTDALRRALRADNGDGFGAVHVLKANW